MHEFSLDFIYNFFCLFQVEYHEMETFNGDSSSVIVDVSTYSCSMILFQYGFETDYYPLD